MARRAYAYNSTTVYHLGLKSLQNTTLRVKRNHLRAAAMTGSDVIVFGIFWQLNGYAAITRNRVA